MVQQLLTSRTKLNCLGDENYESYYFGKKASNKSSNRENG